MPTILLIRHGENEYVAKGRLAGRLPGIHLNENGRDQAEVVAQALSKLPINAVYASPLERCMETAKPLADRLNLPIVSRDGLVEIDFGNWQDKTLKQLNRRKLWKVVQGNPSRMRFPDGETFANAQLRVVAEIEALGGQHQSNEIIACFSHSDPIRLAVAYYLGTPLDLFQRITVSPASISTLYLGKFGVRVIHVNHHVSYAFSDIPQHKRINK